MPSLRTLRGLYRLGVKSLYKFAHEAKRLTHSTYSKRNTCRKSRRVSYRLANKEVS